MGCLDDQLMAARLRAGRRSEEVSEEQFMESYIVGSDPGLQVARIREAERLGATIGCLQNGSVADPLGALRTYGERVLAGLKGTRV